MIQVPVYTEQGGLPYVSMFEELEDGTFKRTQSLPLRQLHENISGISNPQGELVASVFDKLEHDWQTPTVSFHYGRPQSYYSFLREKVSHNKFYVFTMPNLSGRIMRLSLHELKLKQGVSQKILSLLKEKYVESAQLWTEQEYQQRSIAAGSKSSDTSAQQESSLMERSQQRIRKFQQEFQAEKDAERIHEIQEKAYMFFNYDEKSIPVERHTGKTVPMERERDNKNVKAKSWLRRIWSKG